jgi:hypothetical protein
MATPATELDINVCIKGDEVEVTVENQDPVTADWDGNSFSGVKISEFINVVEFHDMTISGKLISSTKMEITVKVTGSGTTKFNIDFTNEACPD